MTATRGAPSIRSAFRRQSTFCPPSRRNRRRASLHPRRILTSSTAAWLKPNVSTKKGRTNMATKTKKPVRAEQSSGNVFADLGLPHPEQERSEERRVGKECRSRWSPYH